MNKRRLLKLADLLEADAKNKKGIKFDLGDWGTVNNPNSPLSCSTQACAMGLAAISGAFNRAGLGYRISDYCGEIDITFNGRKPRGGALRAAQRLFEIDYESAHSLFMPSGYSNEGLPLDGAAGERAVAKRIRDFVADRR